MSKLSRLRESLSPHGRERLATYLATFAELAEAVAAGASEAEKPGLRMSSSAPREGC